MAGNCYFFRNPSSNFTTANLSSKVPFHLP